jgi:hypothetical protein
LFYTPTHASSSVLSRRPGLSLCLWCESHLIRSVGVGTSQRTRPEFLRLAQFSLSNRCTDKGTFAATDKTAVGSQGLWISSIVRNSKQLENTNKLRGP